MAKQFGFEHIRGNRRRADGDEWFARTRAGGVNRARNQLFAGAGLSGEQDINLGRRQSADGAQHLQYRGTAAQQAVALLQGLSIVRRMGVIRLIRRDFARLYESFDQAHQFFGIKRFGNVFGSAFLKRGHGVFQIGVRGHHHHRYVRCELFKIAQQRNPRNARHADVRQQQCGIITGLAFAFRLRVPIVQRL